MTNGPRSGRVATGPVHGLVLCGGQSRRMGADKARLALDGRTLLEHAVGVVSARAERTWLACGYQARYAELGLPLAIDRAPDLGPLAGLEAGLEAVRAECEHTRGDPDAWVLVLACDMPNAEPALFDALLERAVAEGLDACTFASARGPEPLYGVFATRLLPSIRAALARGEAQATAFARFRGDGGRLPRVGSISAAELAPALRSRAVVSNLNTPEDFARARAERAAARRTRARKETA